MIKIIASDKSWIEGSAVRQLETTAELDGIEKAIGMPDIHPGKGSPVGAVFMSREKFYPHIPGNDVGCGMGFWQTSLKSNKIKADKWQKKLSDLENTWDGDIRDWLDTETIETGCFDAAHGTLGGGNHFAELQRVENVFDTEAFEKLTLDKKRLFILIHSGSRALGESLYRSHTDVRGAGFLPEESDEAKAYIKRHDYALKWAASSRKLIAARFMDQVGGYCTPVLDSCHNSITAAMVDGENVWIHRKGATPSDVGPVIIPGSRGSFSYLVTASGDQDSNLWSLAHGAGRKWNRGSCKGRLKGKWNAAALSKTELGSLVICEDKELLYQEAPQAYKNIDTVIRDMTDAGLIKVIASFRPVLTYKTRKK